MKVKAPSTEENFRIFIHNAKHPLSGWGFSQIKDRMVTEPLSWSYTTEILPLFRTVESCLDMGTGGGEYLSSLQPLPKRTCATEGYQPNIPLARKRLEPLKAEVVEVKEDLLLPFKDNSFELIINRHESYSSKEVYRILKPGGQFITQQVGAKNDLELNHLLDSDFSEETLDYSHWDLAYAKKELVEEGLKIITAKEAFPKTRIFDVGAVVYYLKAVPWQMPGFSVEKYLPKLKELHKKIEEEGYLEITSHRFLCKCQK